MSELNLPTPLTIVLVINALLVIVLMDASDAAIKLMVRELSARLLTDAFAAIIVWAVIVLATDIVLNTPTGAISVVVVNELVARLLIDPVRAEIELVVRVLNVPKGAVMRTPVRELTLSVLTEPARDVTLSDIKEDTNTVLIVPFVKLILAACRELISRVLKEI